MDVVAVLVDLLVALWFLAVIVAIARAWQARLPRPKRKVAANINEVATNSTIIS